MSTSSRVAGEVVGVLAGEEDVAAGLVLNLQPIIGPFTNWDYRLAVVTVPTTMPAVRLLQRRGRPPLPMYSLSPRLPIPLRLLMHPLPSVGLPPRETM